jgi:DNA-binding beta-propeller fold protein YncE
MKKFILLLVPLSLFAQVVVDTVIRLPEWPNYACFMPEIDKLCVTGESTFFMLDCSTYQVRAQISLPRPTSLTRFAWNWRRQKLYIACNGPESTLVLDAAGDSILRWLTVSPEFHTSTYVSDVDRLYKPARETLFVFDCAADTIVDRVLPPVSGYGFGYATWDSVGRKLYLGMGGPGPALMGVYDYVTSAFTKVMDVGAISAWQPDAMVVNYRCRRACIADHQVEPGFTDVGIADIDRDSLLRTVPASIAHGMFRQVASDERDGKIYIASADGSGTTPDTLWVYDCATDSVIKKLEYEHRGYGTRCIRWVPWSNRLYLGCIVDLDDQTLDSSLVVLDCNTDSIVGRLPLGRSWPQGIEIDPVHERIFVIGADSGTIHVLRDTGYGGIADAKPGRLGLSLDLQVQMSDGGFEVRYNLASPCRVDLSVYDLMGREVRRLAAEKQSAGMHSIVWNCHDRNDRPAARGVYFIRIDTQGLSDVKKAVVTR